MPVENSARRHTKKRKRKKMSTKQMLAALCAAGLACGLLAEEAKAGTAEKEEKEKRADKRAFVYTDVLEIDADMSSFNDAPTRYKVLS